MGGGSNPPGGSGHGHGGSGGGGGATPADVTNDVHHEFEKRSSNAYGENAHKEEWSPGKYTVYTDMNNPFYYRAPKGAKMSDLPAHVPQNPMNLELHLRDPRQRAFMTEAEREWRRKWIMDQNLHQDEPLYVPDVQFYLNPLRRLYRRPLDLLAEKVIYPKLGNFYGHFLRSWGPKFIMTFIFIDAMYYYIKYNHITWMNHFRPFAYSPDMSLARRTQIEEKYPGLIDKARMQYKTYEDYGYSKRQIFLDVGKTARPW